MKILLLCTAFNGLSQRIHRELARRGHRVSVELSLSPDHMEEAVDLFEPDLVVAPFLKERIPRRIWTRRPCLIVHPGIPGDRGPSSLDWALLEGRHRWGVSLIEAAEEFDAGDLWGHAEFPVREQAGKSSLYRREVTAAAARLVVQAVEDFAAGRARPRPVDPNDPEVEGRARPPMDQASRRIDWLRDDTETVLRKLRAADGQPGVLDELFGAPAYLYGARRERHLTGAPGLWLARRADGLCRATRDGAVWIRMARLREGPEKLCIKRPAAELLDDLCRWRGLANPLPRLADADREDIWWHQDGAVVYLHFDVYNGALSTAQCRRLAAVLDEVKGLSARVIVLMGGEDFWCNGIQLCCAEAAEDPGRASWENLLAMNDLVRAVLDTPDQVTVAALRNNAGAGGAILPLACDRVVARGGVVLNPHYRTMGLYGSEYWTYLLPRRVGAASARRLTRACLPVLAEEARALGLVDECFDEDWSAFHERLARHAQRLAHPPIADALRRRKAEQRRADERIKPLDAYREEEQAVMARCFFDPDSPYHALRRRFVFKQRPPATPPQLALHRAEGGAQAEPAVPELDGLLQGAF